MFLKKDGRLDYKIFLFTVFLFIIMSFTVYGFSMVWDSPQMNDQISNSSNPYTVKVNITNAINLTNVSFYYNNQLIGVNNTLNQTQYIYLWTIPALNGSIQLNATGIDNGSIQNNTNITIFVDNINPIITINSPSDGNYSNTSIMLSYTATDYNLSVCQIWNNQSS